MSTANLRQTTVPITSHYGWRVLNGRDNLHKGTDHAFSKNTGVSAYGAGKVIFAGRAPYYQPGTKFVHPNYERGLYVQITHAPGIETSYHSLSKLGPDIYVGKQVEMGDIIGYGGRTAVGATGDHCHVGLWLNGSHVDSERYLTPGKIVTVSNTGQTADAGSKSIPNTTPSTDTSTNEADAAAKAAAEAEAKRLEEIRRKKARANNMAGTMYRINEGQGVNGVFWQEAPNEPLLPMDLTQYQAYEAQGYTVANFHAMVIQALQRRVGVYELDTTYGRKIVAKDGEYSHNGFKVWLPG